MPWSTVGSFLIFMKYPPEYLELTKTVLTACAVLVPAGIAIAIAYHVKERYWETEFEGKGPEWYFDDFAKFMKGALAFGSISCSVIGAIHWKDAMRELRDATFLIDIFKGVFGPVNGYRTKQIDELTQEFGVLKVSIDHTDPNMKTVRSSLEKKLWVCGVQLLLLTGDVSTYEDQLMDLVKIVGGIVGSAVLFGCVTFISWIIAGYFLNDKFKKGLDNMVCPHDAVIAVETLAKETGDFVNTTIATTTSAVVENVDVMFNKLVQPVRTWYYGCDVLLEGENVIVKHEGKVLFSNCSKDYPDEIKECIATLFELWGEKLSDIFEGSLERFAKRHDIQYRRPENCELEGGEGWDKRNGIIFWNGPDHIQVQRDFEDNLARGHKDDDARALAECYHKSRGIADKLKKFDPDSEDARDLLKEAAQIKDEIHQIYSGSFNAHKGYVNRQKHKAFQIQHAKKFIADINRRAGTGGGVAAGSNSSAVRQQKTAQPSYMGAAHFKNHHMQKFIQAEMEDARDHYKSGTERSYHFGVITPLHYLSNPDLGNLLMQMEEKVSLKMQEDITNEMVRILTSVYGKPTIEKSPTTGEITGYVFPGHKGRTALQTLGEIDWQGKANSGDKTVGVNKPVNNPGGDSKKKRKRTRRKKTSTSNAEANFKNWVDVVKSASTKAEGKEDEAKHYACTTCKKSFKPKHPSHKECSPCHFTKKKDLEGATPQVGITLNQIVKVVLPLRESNNITAACIGSVTFCSTTMGGKSVNGYIANTHNIIKPGCGFVVNDKFYETKRYVWNTHDIVKDLAFLEIMKDSIPAPHNAKPIKFVRVAFSDKPFSGTLVGFDPQKKFELTMTSTIFKTQNKFDLVHEASTDKGSCGRIMINGKGEMVGVHYNGNSGYPQLPNGCWALPFSKN